MADTESLRQIAHARAPLSAWFGVVLLFALFGVIVLAIIGPSPRGSDLRRNPREKARGEFEDVARGSGAKALTTYGWVDKNKGVARIPIERAMELTVAELAKQKPAPAGPIATPEPQPATASAPAASAAAPAASPTPKPSGAASSPQAADCQARNSAERAVSSRQPRPGSASGDQSPSAGRFPSASGTQFPACKLHR